MIDLKPYGAFVENTIRPLIEEMNKFGFKYDKELFDKLITMHIKAKIAESITVIISTIAVCITAYLIAR